MNGGRDAVRVALLAGTLGQGGAEKQLVYMARALRGRGIEVQVFSLTLGEHFEPMLRDSGVPVCWVGRRAHPLWRLGAIRRALATFRPHVVQATHFYMNLYAVLSAPHVGAVALGSVRNDVRHELGSNPIWGRWLLRRPPMLLANSETARANAVTLGLAASRIAVVPNVLDLAAFARRAAAPPIGLELAGPVIVGIARQVRAKRLDRFIRVLALVRAEMPQVSGVLVGDGPEHALLVALAGRAGLLPDGLRFAGRRDDVPAVLARSDALLVTSDHEGFPNVILEAMAAGIPVVTADAGDAGRVVADGVTGFVVQEGGEGALAEKLLELLRAPRLAKSMGAAGRQRVESTYGLDGLADRLVGVYSALVRRERRATLQALLAPYLRHASAGTECA